MQQCCCRRRSWLLEHSHACYSYLQLKSKKILQNRDVVLSLFYGRNQEPPVEDPDDEDDEDLDRVSTSVDMLGATSECSALPSHARPSSSCLCVQLTGATIRDALEHFESESRPSLPKVPSVPELPLDIIKRKQSQKVFLLHIL